MKLTKEQKQEIADLQAKKSNKKSHFSWIKKILYEALPVWIMVLLE